MTYILLYICYCFSYSIWLAYFLSHNYFLWQMAYAWNVRLWFLHLQYTNCLYFDSYTKQAGSQIPNDPKERCYKIANRLIYLFIFIFIFIYFLFIYFYIYLFTVFYSFRVSATNKFNNHACGLFMVISHMPDY